MQSYYIGSRNLLLHECQSALFFQTQIHCHSILHHCLGNGTFSRVFTLVAFSWQVLELSEDLALLDSSHYSLGTDPALPKTTF